MLGLTHTIEELYEAEEPAICVVGTATTTSLDVLNGGKSKIFLKTIAMNKACYEMELEMPPSSVKEFYRERRLLAFGTDKGVFYFVGRHDNIVVLAREEVL